MNDTHRMDKDAGLIKLTVGQICSAGTVHNTITHIDRTLYAVPFMHTVTEWGLSKDVGYTSETKDVGVAIRIDNDGFIISNPSYRGNAIIAFLPIGQGLERTRIHTCKVVKVNKRSVNIEPLEYESVDPEDEMY